MNINIIFFIGGSILFLILIQSVVYFYLKHQRTIFLNHIKNRQYTHIKDIDACIESYSKISTKITYLKSDIIFLDNVIFLLSNKPIIEISNSSENFPSIQQRFKPSTKTISNHILEIKGKTSMGNFKITLNFKNKDFDMDSIISTA